MKMMDANSDVYEILELFGKRVLYTCARLDRSTVPAGLFVYDLRDDCDGIPCTVEPRVIANHFGTIITKEPIEFDGGLSGEDDYKCIGEGDYNFTGEDCSLGEFLKGGS